MNDKIFSDLIIMISIKKNKIINLDIPKFLCDNNSVGEHLNNHPLLKLLNVYGFLCVLGRPGMGKTSLTVSFLTQKNHKYIGKLIIMLLF